MNKLILIIILLGMINLVFAVPSVQLNKTLNYSVSSEYPIINMFSNYSTLNVNNSLFLRGLTPQQVADLYTETDGLSLHLSQDNWFDNDWVFWTAGTSTLAFNDSMLATIYYNASQPNAVAGVIDGGTIADTQHQDGNYDDVTFNFSEQAGSPALDLRMNFTNIEDFNQGIMRYKTSTLAGDYPLIYMWDYDSEDWEEYPAVAESENFATIVQPVFDSADHILNGVAQMRIYKAGNGNTNNHYYVDWVAVSKGYGTPSGNEVDPFSIHTDAINLTQMNYTGGQLNILESWITSLIGNLYCKLTGCEITGNLNVTQNISAQYLCDTFGSCTNISTFINDADAIFTDTQVFWAERGAIVSGQPWAWGNGRSVRGSSAGYNSTVVKIGVECLTAGTTLVAGVRKNGLVTTCNVTATTNNIAFTNDCNVTFNETDIIGIYAEMEVNDWTDCVGTVWVDRDKTIQISGLKGDKGDTGVSGFKTLSIGACSKDADSMTWEVQAKDDEGNDLAQVVVPKCWQSETTPNITATDDMVCSDGGSGTPLYSDVSGSKYYYTSVSDNSGTLDIDCSGSSGGGADCWLMCEYDGVLYTSPECDTCPSGLPPE